MAQKHSFRIFERLDWLESRLQRLIEGSLARIFPGSSIQTGLIHQLVASMHANIEIQQDDTILAPNRYLVQANPRTAAQLQAEPQLLEHLVASLYETGGEAGFTFASRPQIQIEASPNLSRDDLLVWASHNETQIADTAMHNLGQVSAAKIPEDAFLIVDGTQVFSLNEPVINIGSSASNQLVIDDERAAPHHAQLRAVQGRFVLFNVDTQGSVLVNGQPAMQSVLQEGDVILLGGIPLVYGQERSPSSTQTYYPDGAAKNE